MAEHLRGVVECITYQNAENGYSVLRLRAKGFADLIITTTWFGVAGTRRM